MPDKTIAMREDIKNPQKQIKLANKEGAMRRIENNVLHNRSSTECRLVESRLQYGSAFAPPLLHWKVRALSPVLSLHRYRLGLIYTVQVVFVLI